MRKVNRAPQEFLLAVAAQIKLVEKQLNNRVIGATIDWQNLDAIPYSDGFFNKVNESIVEILLPVKLVTERGIHKLDITAYMSALTLLDGQQFYMQNPYYGRDSPKRYMFSHDDFRHEVLEYVRENFDFDHSFYVLAQGSQSALRQVSLQESFELNLHYMVSPVFTSTFPFIGATGMGLESLFTIYYGYWLHTKMMLKIIQQDVPAYRRSESNLLAPNTEGIAPYTAFKSQMDNLYRSAFYALQNSPATPPRRYMLFYKYQGADCYIFLSPYASVCVNVGLCKCLVIHDVLALPKEHGLPRAMALDIPLFTHLLQEYYSNVM